MLAFYQTIDEQGKKGIVKKWEGSRIESASTQETNNN